MSWVRGQSLAGVVVVSATMLATTVVSASASQDPSFYVTRADLTPLWKRAVPIRSFGTYGPEEFLCQGATQPVPMPHLPMRRLIYLQPFEVGPRSTRFLGAGSLWTVTYVFASHRTAGAKMQKIADRLNRCTPLSRTTGTYGDWTVRQEVSKTGGVFGGLGRSLFTTEVDEGVQREVNDVSIRQIGRTVTFVRYHRLRIAGSDPFGGNRKAQSAVDYVSLLLASRYNLVPVGLGRG